MQIFNLNQKNLPQILKSVRSLNTIDTNVLNIVRKIIEDVRINGDRAIIEYTKKFDGIALEPNKIRVTREEIIKSYDYVNENELSAIKALIENIKNIENETVKNLEFTIKLNDIIISQVTKPLESVGCYIPGGKASYPSTLIMTATPASIVNVRRIVVTSPPNKISPLFLVAADIIGVSEIYRIGGAQAIAALAYGTESIKPVNKIVGPGNIYVTAAKLLVSNDVAIDMPAGPTELLIVADDNANPTEIALDLIAQAEHGVDSLCGLITTSTELAKNVVNELSRLINSIDRKEIVDKALNERGFIIITDDKTVLQEFVNQFAPEHLEIIMKDGAEIAKSINNAGVIIIGTSSVITDYYAGVNHVLPTNSYAKIRGGLTVLDYIKLIRLVSASNNSLNKAINVIKTLAYAEGLPNHFKSIEYRVDYSQSQENHFG
jgi:histidinol dehydrogenase